MRRFCTRWLTHALLLLVFCGLPLGQAMAHPHVWITYTLHVVSNKSGISKLQFNWRFDQMFTSMVQEDFNLKNISEKDSAFLKDKAFSNLKNFHYYLWIKADGVDVIPDDVGDFVAKMHGDQLGYTFTVALPKPTQKLELSLFDDSFYVDLSPPMKETISDKVSSFMSPRSFEPKDFVFSTAEDGAKPAVCARKKTPHVSDVWGTFNTYTLICQAGAPG